MYEHTYDTEWTELSRREAIDRAFALGVAAGCGAERPDELDRIVSEVESAYDRSLVELSYEEGRTKALEATESEPEAVWDRLVDGNGTPRATPLPAALPGGLSELAVSKKPRDGPPSSLELPSLLRK